MPRGGDAPALELLGERLREAAASAAVAEVDHEADQQPHDEPHPVLPAEREHEREVREHAEPRHHRDHGVRNGRGRSGFVRRMTITAVHTITKAMSVPMFTSSASSLSGKTAAAAATSTPVKIVARCGVRKRGCTAPKKR